jgi:hypothetical protein
MNAKTIGGVVVAVLVVLFFVSDPFNMWVKVTLKPGIEWTPERIQKSPKLYLEWAQEKLGETRDSLEAREIKMKELRGKYERELAAAKTESSSLGKKLELFKEKYSYGESTAWPVSIPTSGGSVEMDKKQVEKKTGEALKKKKGTDKKVKMYTAQLTKVNSGIKKIGKRQEELVEKKEHLALQKEMFILEMEMKQVEGLMDGVEAVLDIAEVVGGEELGEIDLGDIMVDEESSSEAVDFLKGDSETEEGKKDTEGDAS